MVSYNMKGGSIWKQNEAKWYNFFLVLLLQWGCNNTVTSCNDAPLGAVKLARLVRFLRFIVCGG